MDGLLTRRLRVKFERLENVGVALAVRWRRRCSSPTFRSFGGEPFFDGSYANARAGKAPMSVQAPHPGIILLVVESSTRRRWPEHNAPAAGFSTSIAQSSGRTGRGLALNLNETENALFPRRIFFSGKFENPSIHPSFARRLVLSQDRSLAKK